MPWKEYSVMDERMRFVIRLKDRESMAALCREFGISRKTGYKILDRYEECSVCGDVSKKDDIHPIAIQILGVLGGLDVLVNSASDLGPARLALLADTECEDLERALRTNVLGPFRLTKAVGSAGLLRPRGPRSRGLERFERCRHQSVSALGRLWREQGCPTPFERHGSGGAMTAARLPIQRPRQAKLLALDSHGKIRHLARSKVMDLFHPGDLVIANDAATLPASLSGEHLRTGRFIEVRLAARRSLAADSIRHCNAVFLGRGTSASVPKIGQSPRK